MHLVLSGEGPTDIGLFYYCSNDFLPGSMYYIIDKIIEKKHYYSYYDDCPESITFIPKSELVKVCKSMKTLVGKKQHKETGYFFKNAKGLSLIAKKKCIEKKDDDVIAILFRDSDGTCATISGLWEKKIESIENAFNLEKINGIAMVPNPKSESWLICALKDSKYQNCEKLENRSGNDDSPNSLKKELEKILKKSNKEYHEINDMIKNGEIEIDKIKMPSFDYFLNKINSLI